MGACSSTPTAVDTTPAANYGGHTNAAAGANPSATKKEGARTLVNDESSNKVVVVDDGAAKLAQHDSMSGGNKGVTFTERKLEVASTDPLSTSAIMSPPIGSTAITSSTNTSPTSTNENNDHHRRLPSQDVSLCSNFSTDSNSSHSSNDGDRSNHNTNNANKKNNNHHHNKSNKNHNDLSSSHQRRRKSRQLTHSDSKVGLNEIICGDIKNPNLVRIEVPLGKPIEQVYEGVHDGPVLGSGISGIVRLVKHRATQVSYAVKCLELALIDSEEGLKQLKEEIYIMCQLDHPNIVRLEEVYESHSEIYLVQEVCKGGELFDRLDEQPDYHYTEAQCARLVKQMLSSVRYIHNKGIIHRDLKLENFLFSGTEAASELKMIDFGLSKHFTFGEVQHEAVGTPYTVAPEVIRGGYDERCDVWAIGVITYLLLSGEPPFGGCGGPETLMQVRDNILRGAFHFEPVEVWETVSLEAKEFIKSLLVIDPMDRPTARQAKESKWLQMWLNRDNNEISDEDAMINPNVVKALVGFKEYSDMRKLLCEVLSFTLLPEQIQGLRKEFEKYDQEGTGEITLSTLKKVLIGNASTGSLGGLTEEEVVDIFNAMRVRQLGGETSIHWHDFIAAGLSQCQVDDRNLRLAFERLDQEHKGYITFENVMDLMGDDAFENEDQMLQMWGESMKDVNCMTALINYEDFVLLMKGQKRDRETRWVLRSSVEGLAAVPEIAFEEDEDGHNDIMHTPLGSFNETESPMLALPLDAPDVITPIRKPPLSRKEVSPDLSASPARTKTFLRMGSNSAPPTPIHFGKRFDETEEADSPLSMDAVDESGSVSFNEQYAVFTMPDLDLTPPQTPVRGPADYVTPTAARGTFNPQLIANLSLSPPDLSLPGDKALHSSLTFHPSLARGRSVSLDEKETHSSKEQAESRKKMMFKRDSRRAMAIPEHTHNVSAIDRVIADTTKTPLVVNRKLYRAHREFRHAVTEACKRFEDEQMRRAMETLRAQESAGAKYSAGLVMRHGQALSESSIKSFLAKTLEEQQKKVDQANRRGGRGRRSRKKTISDMSGMLGGPALPEATVEERKTVNVTPKQEALAPVKENENLLRNPTKPGEFRKTNYDPFQRKSLFENSACKSDGMPPGMPSTPPPPLV
mmetsp:Transcript_32638/g.68624  ORF Transcript_32638/g.68624 Transcript_32638/m.68624 type:complete len:1139 (-) Transcript_32638:104-3520(-)